MAVLALTYYKEPLIHHRIYLLIINETLCYSVSEFFSHSLPMSDHGNRLHAVFPLKQPWENIKLSVWAEKLFIASMWPLNIVSMKSTPTVPGWWNSERHQKCLSIQVGPLECAVVWAVFLCVWAFLAQQSLMKRWVFRLHYLQFTSSNAL